MASTTTPTRTSVNAGIGRNVATLRAAADLSREKLASAIGIHADVLRAIEAGRRPLRFTEALDLARVLGVPVTALAEATAAQIASQSSVTVTLSARQDELSHRAAQLSSRADRLHREAADLQALIASSAPHVVMAPHQAAA